jgi:hypothetical protein
VSHTTLNIACLLAFVGAAFYFTLMPYMTRPGDDT